MKFGMDFIDETIESLLRYEFWLYQFRGINILKSRYPLLNKSIATYGLLLIFVLLNPCSFRTKSLSKYKM